MNHIFMIDDFIILLLGDEKDYLYHQRTDIQNRRYKGISGIKNPSIRVSLNFQFYLNTIYVMGDMHKTLWHRSYMTVKFIFLVYDKLLYIKARRGSISTPSIMPALLGTVSGDQHRCWQLSPAMIENLGSKNILSLSET